MFDVISITNSVYFNLLFLFLFFDMLLVVPKQWWCRSSNSANVIPTDKVRERERERERSDKQKCLSLCVGILKMVGWFEKSTATLYSQSVGQVRLINSIYSVVFIHHNGSTNYILSCMFVYIKCMCLLPSLSLSFSLSLSLSHQ